MMKKSILLLLVVSACLSASGQNWTTVSATNITDLNQQKLAAGQLCFLATDQNDNPISIGIGGGGQLLRRAFCSTVSNGAVTGFSVPNPANTAPAGAMYRVTVNDTSVGKEVLRYTQVAFTGATFNFDAYAPTGPGPLPPLGSTVNGNLNVNGNLSLSGSITGSSLNGSADLTLQAGSTNFIHLIRPVGISSGSFTPTLGALLHVQCILCGFSNDITIEDTGAANAGLGIKNSLESWSIAVRNDLGQDLTFRDTTAGVDRLRLSTSGLLLIPGSVKINTGVSNSGTGLQHVRGTTGSLAANSRSEILLSWPATWVNTSYTVACSIEDSTTGATLVGLIGERVRTKSTTQIGFVVNNATTGALTGIVDCTAMHD